MLPLFSSVVMLFSIDNLSPSFPLIQLFSVHATESIYKFLSEFEGDKRQLRRLYEACKGIRMPQVFKNSSMSASAVGIFYISIY